MADDSAQNANYSADAGLAASDLVLHAGEQRSGILDETPGANRRLRAFEDETLGKDAPRISGNLERGHGSLFSRLTDAQRAHHAKLVKLTETETRLADASAHLEAAQVAHDAALKAVEDAPAAE